MTTKAVTYVQQSLAFTGFAFLSGEIAVETRPDLFTIGFEASLDFAEAQRRNLFANFPRVQRMTVKLVGRDQVFTVLARSPDMLMDRIEWLTGYQVEEIKPEEVAPAVPVAKAAGPTAEREAKVASLKALAEQEPPAHDCALRRDILAAKAELARMAA